MPFQRTYPGARRNRSHTRWYLIQADKVVLRMHEGALALPDSRPEEGLAELHFGTDDTSDFVAVLLNPSAALPAGHRAFGIRDLFGRIEDEHYAAAGYALQLAHWHHTSRFCMRCGGPLIGMTREWGKRCADDACNWTMYPPVNPCTITVVHDGEHILLTHKHGWGPRYGLVAGFVEPGESLEDNVRREVAEEVGVTVGRIDYARSQPWPFPHQIMVGFFAEFAGGEVRIDREELDDARWFHVDALPHIPPPLSIARQLINAWAARLGRDTTRLEVR